MLDSLPRASFAAFDDEGTSAYASSSIESSIACIASCCDWIFPFKSSLSFFTLSSSLMRASVILFDILEYLSVLKRQSGRRRVYYESHRDVMQCSINVQFTFEVFLKG